MWANLGQQWPFYKKFLPKNLVNEIYYEGKMIIKFILYRGVDIFLLLVENNSWKKNERIRKNMFFLFKSKTIFRKKIDPPLPISLNS